MAQGVAAFGQGDLDAAAAHLTQALERARTRADHWFVGECGSVLTHVHFAQAGYATGRAVEETTGEVWNEHWRPRLSACSRRRP